MADRLFSFGACKIAARFAVNPAGMFVIRLRTAVLTTCACLLLLATSKSGLAEVSKRLPTLTSTTAVRSLTPQEARRAYPIRLRAVVTYFDSLSPGMFVQDAYGGIFIGWTPNLPQASAGDLL